MPGSAIFALIRSHYFFWLYAPSPLKSYCSKSLFRHSSHDFPGWFFFLFPVISTSTTLTYLRIDVSEHDMTIPPQTALNYYILNRHNIIHPVTKNNLSHLTHHQAKNEVVLFPEMNWVNIFLSLWESIVESIHFWEYIFFVQKKHTKTKNFHWQIYSNKFTLFSLQKIKDRVLCFSTKKSAVRVVV